jgi:hypothetical protein
MFLLARTWKARDDTQVPSVKPFAVGELQRVPLRMHDAEAGT